MRAQLIVVALLGLGCAASHGRSDVDASSSLDSAVLDARRPDARLDAPRDLGGDASDARDCDFDEDGFVGSECGGPDCDDRDPSRSPAALERCDGADDDCDGAADEGTTSVFHGDADGDGHGDPAVSMTACVAPDGYVSSDDDCDDTDPERYPGAPLVVPQPLAPENGAVTGSVHAGDLTRRPTFVWRGGGACEAEFQLQVDDSCAVASFLDCAFASAEVDVQTSRSDFRVPTALPVDTVAPVGRRYYWRLRTCEGDRCSAWSRTRYVDVGRTFGDYDGDGYADLAADLRYGGPTFGEGAVVVFHGGATGVDDAPWATLTDPDHEAFAAFGSGLAAVGDVNADGFGDLVVGAPGKASQRGVMFLYLGGATGLSLPTRFALPSAARNQAVGALVRMGGDVNGDGYGDVLIGAGEAGRHPREVGVIAYGLAAVFVGSPTGLEPEPLATLTHPTTEEEDFGHAGAAGDLNADGFADLILGSSFLPGARLAVSDGSSAFGPLTPWVDRKSNFGDLAALDLDGDAQTDFLAQAWAGRLASWNGRTHALGPERRVVEERVHPRHMAAFRDPSGVRIVVSQDHRPCVWHLGPARDWMEADVAELCVEGLGWSNVEVHGTLLDVNGDGFLDAVVALASTDEEGVGRLAIWFGGAAPHTPRVPDRLVVTPTALGGRFGVSLGD